MRYRKVIQQGKRWQLWAEALTRARVIHKVKKKNWH